MIREAATQQPDKTLDCDVCVIGAGAAGIPLALTLAEQGRQICLLEAGGDALQSAVQGVYRGAEGTEGFLGIEDYVWSSRLRFLGGTTNHWAGECAPLSPSDFAARDWVPHSGWPIDAETLGPYYERAAAWLELPEGAAARASEADDAGFGVAAPEWSPPTRFGAHYRGTLAGNSAVDTLLRANVTALEANEAGTRVERVRVAAYPSGDRFALRPRVTVLACGALENARLLLASRARLGNAKDLVGRFFTDGLEGRVGELLVLRAPGQPISDDLRDQRVVGASAEVQREHRLLNTRFRLEPVPVRASGFIGELGQLIANVAGAARGGRTTPGRAGISRVIVGTEMAPNPDNRVRLGQETDRYGMPRLVLEASPGATEADSIARATRQLALALGASLSGRLQVEIEPEDPWSRIAPAQHPAGTTRMHESPEHGVVDANCKVHGVSNLYVAGSSVFPTLGRARPTWTLLALALRLADHLAKEGAA